MLGTVPAMTRRSPTQWLRDHPAAADALLAALVFAIVIGGLLTIRSDSPSGSNRDLDALGVALALFQPLLLTVRRRWPVRALWVSALTLVPYWVLDYIDPGVSIAVLLLIYTVGAHVPRARSLPHVAAVGLILSGVMVIGVVADEEDLPLVAAVGNTIVFATAWVLGDSMRNRRAYLAEVEARAERAEADREAAAERAVLDERGRIARELHDVVAHSVSVMVVQAGAARRVIDRHPDQATESLGIIERTGRDALDELRRVLGVLRSDGARPDGPQPTVDDVSALIERWRAAGLEIALRVDGRSGALAPGVSLTVYRVIQEALTNVMKHACPATVTVDIRHRDDAVTILVTDDGRGPRSTDPGIPSSGQGLIGMRERVELFGGSLATGPRPGGGFQVRATIPIGAATSTPTPPSHSASERT